MHRYEWNCGGSILLFTRRHKLKSPSTCRQGLASAEIRAERSDITLSFAACRFDDARQVLSAASGRMPTRAVPPGVVAKPLC